MTRTWTVVVCLAAAGALAAPVLAASQPSGPESGAGRAEKAEPGWSKAVATIGVCLGAALAALGGAFGVGRIGSACVEAIARQPEAARDMFAPMVVAAGMVEVGMLFAIVVCLLSLFQL